MKIARFLPLLLLPVGLAAWAQTGPSTEEAVVGVGLGGLLATALLAFVRGNEMKEALVAVTRVIVGQSARTDTGSARLDALEGTVARMRRSVGQAVTPEEPPPGVGLLIDVARHGEEICGLRDEVAGLKAAVEKGNALLTQVLAAMVGDHAKP